MIYAIVIVSGCDRFPLKFKSDWTTGCKVVSVASLAPRESLPLRPVAGEGACHSSWLGAALDSGGRFFPLGSLLEAQLCLWALCKQGSERGIARKVALTTESFTGYIPARLWIAPLEEASLPTSGTSRGSHVLVLVTLGDGSASQPTHTPTRKTWHA